MRSRFAIDFNFDLYLYLHACRITKRFSSWQPRTNQCRRSAVWSRNINGEDRIWLPGSSAQRARQLVESSSLVINAAAAFDVSLYNVPKGHDRSIKPRTRTHARTERNGTLHRPPTVYAKLPQNFLKVVRMLRRFICCRELIVSK